MRLSEALAAIALVWGALMLLLAAIDAPAVLFAIASAVAAGFAGISYARCSCVSYEFLQDSLIVHCGIFFKMRDVVPYRKIERVAIARNRADAIFDVCELRIRPAHSVIIDTAGIGPEEQAEEFSCLQHSHEYVLLMRKAQAQETASFVRGRIEELRKEDELRAARR